MLLFNVRVGGPSLFLTALTCLGIAGCGTSDCQTSQLPGSAQAETPSLTVAGAVPPSPLPAATPSADPAVAMPLPPPASSGTGSSEGIVPARFDAPAEGDDAGLRPNPLRRGKDQPETDAAKSAAEAPAPFTKTGKHSGIPFDPVKENGKFFENWAKPKLAIVVTGRQDGYLEPCGCAGLDRMKGGLMRRYSFFQELRRDRDWPVVAVDVGGISKGFGRQAELKFQTTVEAMRKMRYDAIAFGRGELRLPAGELVSVAASVDGKPSAFVSANVGLFGFASGLTATKRIVQAGGMKIGITAVLGEKYQKDINNADIEIVPPQAALQKTLAELQKEKCDFLILLAHATVEESLELAEKFPDFDLVVTAGGVGEPPSAKGPTIGTKTLMVEVGEKGIGAVVLGVYDGEPRLRYQRVLFDSRYPNAPEIKSLFAAYQGQLKALGLDGLGVRTVPYAQRNTLGAFVGSAKCQTCHEESYKIWKKSGHARAYETLTKTDPPRNFDPECISCHVIGWHPTEYFPFRGGFLTTEKTPELIDVGCESCHGAGGAHCEAEIKNDKALQEKIQKAMTVTKAEAEKHLCATCHDLDNSPDFDFPSYWPKVEHYEK